MESIMFKPFLQKVWEKSGFSKPMDIQEKTIPVLLEGKDVIAESPTGTGKTLAYLLPLLEKIDTEKGLQAVILAPSRELVMQIFSEVQKWSEGSGIVSASLIGGTNPQRQLEKLKQRPQVIVATTGRVQELIQAKKIKMHEVQVIVFDEGDQLLIPEQVETIQKIVKSTMRTRQLVLFSATVSSRTEQLAKEMMSEPIIVKVEKQASEKAKVEHLYIVCEAREKVELVRKLVKMPTIKALVFFKDIGELNVVNQKLRYKQTNLGILHSELRKEERVTALKQFRLSQFPALLATDVATRGLDIEGLTHVIHYNVAENFDTYIHRSGRTGRAFGTGTVISLVTIREEQNLKAYEKKLGVQLQKMEVSRGKVIPVQEKKFTSYQKVKKK